MASEFIDRMMPELWCRRMAEPKTQTDIEFRCSDGNISAHKLFLKMFCLTLEKCLTNQDSDQDEVVVVVLPEIGVGIVSKFLELVYTGSTCVSSNDEMEEVNHLGAKILGFFMDLNLNISVEPISEEDRARDSDSYSIEDCSVAPPICIYFGDDDEDGNTSENGYQQQVPAKRRKIAESETKTDSSATIKCPECDETFMTLVKLHTHAVNCHYYGQMKSLLQPQYKLSKGYCTECQKPTASLQSFMYHMGVKHRVVFAVMSEEMSYRYMSQVPEDFKIDDNGASTHDEMSNDQMYCQTEDFYTPPSRSKVNIVQCPECSIFLENAQSLYAHSIGFHHYKKMATRLEPEFRRTNGVCMYCNKRTQTLSSFIHHLGLQHKLLHQYIAPHLIAVYNTFLEVEEGTRVRQRAPRNTKGTIPCPEADCPKAFDSISALYFHAAAIHYKKPLQEMYGEEFKRVKGNCTVCGSRLNSKQYYYIHMGSRHRVIQQLMDSETLQKYEKYGK